MTIGDYVQVQRGRFSGEYCHIIGLTLYGWVVSFGHFITTLAEDDLTYVNRDSL